VGAETTEKEETMRSRLIRIGVVLAVLAVLAVGGTAWAVSSDDGDESVTGPAADRARAAALTHVENGTATAVERESEDGATWEVEVRRADGSTVDVLLDERYKLVALEGDSDTVDDDGSEGAEDDD
jgi:hypothetical protein